MLFFDFSIIKGIEKNTQSLTIVHFLLNFGYKLFSLYFPLFLIANNLSIHQVGYVYLLIYLSISFFSSIVGYLNHKINPAFLAFWGILGYGIYSLAMILVSPQEGLIGLVLFYFFQIVLGFSAALFFVSSRGIIMGFSSQKPSRSFGWFYSAPFYANALAPAVGAFLIWQFNFTGVFVVSMIIHVINAFFCLFKLLKPAQLLVDIGFNFSDFKESFSSSFNVIKEKKTFYPFLLSLLMILLIGFYRAFFALFLKQGLGWEENLILVFITVSSILFVPLSFLIVKELGKQSINRSIFNGSLLIGLSTILIGLIIPILGFFTTLIINSGEMIGRLVIDSSKSGLIYKKLKDFPEEGGVIDTVSSSLSIALGALMSGFLISLIGFNLSFIIIGLFAIFFIILFSFSKSFDY